jgi:hypothetical protein
VVVAAGDVGRQVDGGCLAGRQQSPDDLGDDQLGEQGAGDRGHRADGAAVGQGEDRVAVRRAVVEGDVGVVDQLGAGRVAGVHRRRLGEGRDRDQPVPLLLHQPRELDDRAVDAGVGADHEDVGGRRPGEVVQPVGDRRVPLQVPVAEDGGRLAAEDDHVPQGDPVGRHQPARAAGELHGQGLGVPGPECLEDAAGPQRRHHQVGRLLHRPVGLPLDLGQDRAEGVEVGLGAHGASASPGATVGRADRIRH